MSDTYRIGVHERGISINKRESAVLGLICRIPIHIEHGAPKIQGAGLLFSPNQVACGDPHRNFHVPFLQKLVFVFAVWIVAAPVGALGGSVMACQTHPIFVGCAGCGHTYALGLIKSGREGGQQDGGEKLSFEDV